MRAFWLVLLAVIAACQPPTPTPLRIGVNAWLGYDSLVLAQETGFSDRSQVRIVEMMSASDTQRAMADGLLDGAALTLDEAKLLAPSVELTAEQYTTALGDLTLRSVAESASLLRGPSPVLSSGSRRMAEFLVQGKYLQRAPNWSALIDAGPAAQARDLLAGVP